MPIYEYECQVCQARFEVIQKFSDKPLKKCAQCGGGPLVKVLSPPALVFKGTGWYVTDYARPEREKARRKAEGTSKGNGSGSSGTSSGESTATTAAPAAAKTGD